MVLLVWLTAPLATASSDEPRVLILGDSLSAAYGIPRDAGWVAHLQRRIAQANYPHHIINASITGDTTKGGLARLPAALERHHPDLVVIELGGNDGLRGLSLTQMRDNLLRIVDISQAAGAKVLILGVRIPANYGQNYADRFQQVYAEVSTLRPVALVPFFLAGVAETRDGMLPDGIHPGVAAQPAILNNVWPVLEPLLASPK